MHASRQDALTSLGLLILRVGMGAYMASHGWGKVHMVINRQWEQFADPIGIGKAPSLVLAAGAEFVCALMVAVGLLTRLAAAPVAFTMAVAAFMVHTNDPWTMGKAYELFKAKQTEFPASKEPALVFMIAFLAIVFTGPGRISLDALIFGRKRTDAAPAGS